MESDGNGLSNVHRTHLRLWHSQHTIFIIGAEGNSQEKTAHITLSVGVSESVDGDTAYVDYERIRKHGGYVYYWRLSDYLNPSPHGSLSAKTYTQGDCKLFRYKDLSYYFYKEPLGRGTGDSNSPKNPQWEQTWGQTGSTNSELFRGRCRCLAHGENLQRCEEKAET